MSSQGMDEICLCIATRVAWHFMETACLWTYSRWHRKETSTEDGDEGHHLWEDISLGLVSVSLKRTSLAVILLLQSRVSLGGWPQWSLGSMTADVHRCRAPNEVHRSSGCSMQAEHVLMCHIYRTPEDPCVASNGLHWQMQVI